MLERNHRKVFWDKIQTTQAFPAFQIHKKGFLCAVSTENVHCAGIKFSEFISLLNIFIQYLQVRDFLLYSGGFRNPLFSPLHCHNFVVSSVVWQPLLQPFQQQYTLQQCFQCSQWWEMVWQWRAHGIGAEQLQLPSRDISWQWHWHHFLWPQPRQHRLPGGCHITPHRAAQGEGGTAVAQLQRSGLHCRQDIRKRQPHGQESWILAQPGYSQQESASLQPSHKGEQCLQFKWCCLTYKVIFTSCVSAPQHAFSHSHSLTYEKWEVDVEERGSTYVNQCFERFHYAGCLKTKTSFCICYYI